MRCRVSGQYTARVFAATAASSLCARIAARAAARRSRRNCMPNMLPCAARRALESTGVRTPRDGVPSEATCEPLCHDHGREKTPGQERSA